MKEEEDRKRIGRRERRMGTRERSMETSGGWYGRLRG